MMARIYLLALACCFNVGSAQFPGAPGVSLGPLVSGSEEAAPSGYVLYSLLQVKRTASREEILTAYRDRIAELERNVKRKQWFAKTPYATSLEALFATLDADQDGVLNAAESKEILGVLQFEMSEACKEEYAAFRSRAEGRLFGKPRVADDGFSSPAQVLGAVMFAAFVRAKETLVITELRAAYDAEERNRVLAAAEDLVRTSSPSLSSRALPSVSLAIILFTLSYLFILTFCAATWVVAALSEELLAWAAGENFFGLRVKLAAWRGWAAGYLLFLRPPVGAVARWLRRRMGWDGLVLLAFAMPKVVTALVAAASGLFNLTSVALTTHAAHARLCCVLAACGLGVAVRKKRVWLSRQLVLLLSPAVIARRLVETARLARRAVVAAFKAIAGTVACVFVACAYALCTDFVERHGLTFMGALIVAVLLIGPLRRRIISAVLERAAAPFARALADSGLGAAPEVHLGIALALERLNQLPIVEFASAESLTEAQLKLRLEDAGFRRQDTTTEPTREDLVRAYDDFAFGTCSVCLATFEDGDLTKRLEYCAHVFHTSCLDQWVATCATQHRPLSCPYCQSKIGREEFPPTNIQQQQHQQQHHPPPAAPPPGVI